MVDRVCFLAGFGGAHPVEGAPQLRIVGEVYLEGLLVLDEAR